MKKAAICCLLSICFSLLSISVSFAGNMPAFTKSEITDDVKKDMEISDANGRMVLDNLKAGVYYITAIPVKGKETATTTPLLI